MKADATVAGRPVTVYVYELCYYGERGDFEVFPAEQLAMNIAEVAAAAAAGGARVDYAEGDTLIVVYPDGVICSAFADGRVIVENIKPPSPEAAFDRAAELIPYRRKEELN